MSGHDGQTGAADALAAPVAAMLRDPAGRLLAAWAEDPAHAGEIAAGAGRALVLAGLTDLGVLDASLTRPHRAPVPRRHGTGAARPPTAPAARARPASPRCSRAPPWASGSRRQTGGCWRPTPRWARSSGLRAVAQRLTADLVPDGHLVARRGGDEFVVLVEQGGAAELERVPGRILDTVRRPLRLDGRDVTVTASVGVVRRSDGGDTADELLEAADTTLMWAKDDGRDRCAFFDHDRHRAHIERFARAAGPPDALAREEFLVCYQPLVRLADARLVGVEALVRRERPGHDRPLGPDDVVPLAEESGLIVPLGRWVLEQACAQAVRWRAGPGGEDVSVRVNLAVRQVHEPGLVDDVARVLRETGLPPAALQLELTETAAMATTGARLVVLRRLAALGVRIAIDDFGTGYSNLAYLRELPVHVLKLAGSFVTGRGTGPGVTGDAIDATTPTSWPTSCAPRTRSGCP